MTTFTSSTPFSALPPFSSFFFFFLEKSKRKFLFITKRGPSFSFRRTLQMGKFFYIRLKKLRSMKIETSNFRFLLTLHLLLPVHCRSFFTSFRPLTHRPIQSGPTGKNPSGNSVRPTVYFRSTFPSFLHISEKLQNFL